MSSIRATFEHRVLPALLAVLSGISLAAVVVEGSVGSDSLLARFTDEIDGVGPVFLVAVVALAVFYTRFWDAFRESSGPVTHVLAAVFAAFMLVGMSYEALDSWDFILGRKKDLAFALVVFAGYLALFDFCLAWLYRWLDGRLGAGADATSVPVARVETGKVVTASALAAGAGAVPGATSGAAVAEGEGSPTRTGRLAAWADGHWFLFCLIVICLCWSPFLILNLPGSVPYDGYYQLNQAMGISSLTNHHPWVLTLLYGLLFRLGRVVSDNFGIFLVVAFFYVAEALCYAEVCQLVRRWQAPEAFNVITLLFFALLPCFGAYAQALDKDGIYTALVVLFFALYVDVCITVRRTQEIDHPVRRFVALLLLELAVCLTRNNGVYLVVPADVLLLFFLLKSQKAWAVLLALCVGLSYWVVENPVADAVGVEPGSVKEALSIPFQQTARYLSEYPDDVTEEEAEAIDAVLEYDELAELYNPELSDPVKSTYHGESTEDLISYFTDAWLPMFLRHPGVYVESLLNNCFGYLYPFYNQDFKATWLLHIQGDPVATGDLDIHYLFDDGLRNGATSSYADLWEESLTGIYCEAWRTIPGLAQLVNPGTYTWVLLICAGYLCRRKRYRDLLVLAAPALSLAVCIASPVNGLLRYALPLIACTPVIIAWCVGSFGRHSGSDLANHSFGTSHVGMGDSPSSGVKEERLRGRHFKTAV